MFTNGPYDWSPRLNFGTTCARFRAGACSKAFGACCGPKEPNIRKNEAAFSGRFEFHLFVYMPKSGTRGQGQENPRTTHGRYGSPPTMCGPVCNSQLMLQGPQRVGFPSIGLRCRTGSRGGLVPVHGLGPARRPQSHDLAPAHHRLYRRHGSFGKASDRRPGDGNVEGSGLAEVKVISMAQVVFVAVRFPEARCLWFC